MTPGLPIPTELRPRCGPRPNESLHFPSQQGNPRGRLVLVLNIRRIVENSGRVRLDGRGSPCDLVVVHLDRHGEPSFTRPDRDSLTMPNPACFAIPGLAASCARTSIRRRSAEDGLHRRDVGVAVEVVEDRGLHDVPLGDADADCRLPGGAILRLGRWHPLLFVPRGQVAGEHALDLRGDPRRHPAELSIAYGRRPELYEDTDVADLRPDAA